MTHHTEFLPEAAEAFRKGGAFVYDQNQTILCRRGRTKFFENMESITSEMVFTESLLLEKGQKRAFIQEILFSYSRKRALFSPLKKVGGGHMPPLPPGSVAPGFYNRVFI